MAKTFTSLRKTSGLLDILTFGKYKGCRIDSIVEMDYEYLIYLHDKKILVLDKSVRDKIDLLFSAESIEVEQPNPKPLDCYTFMTKSNHYDDVDYDNNFSDDDIPF